MFKKIGKNFSILTAFVLSLIMCFAFIQESACAASLYNVNGNTYTTTYSVNSYLNSKYAFYSSSSSKPNCRYSLYNNTNQTQHLSIVFLNTNGTTSQPYTLTIPAYSTGNLVWNKPAQIRIINNGSTTATGSLTVSATSSPAS